MRRTALLVGMSLSSLRRRPLRVALTSLGVMIASGALMTMLSLALGLQNRFNEPFNKFELFNTINVWPPQATDPLPFDAPEGRDGPPGAAVIRGSDRDEEQPVVPMDDAALERIAALDGVELAYPQLRAANIRIVCDSKETRAMAMGLPRAASFSGYFEEVVAAGGFFSQEAKPELILGVSLVKDLGFKKPEDAIGHTVLVEASGLQRTDGATFAFESEQFEMEIAGVYSGQGISPLFPTRMAVLPIDQMVKVPGVKTGAAISELRAGKEEASDGYRRAIVRVESPADVERVEKQIREMGFETQSALQGMEEMQGVFIFMDVLVLVVGAVALVIATLGIINTQLMAVLERYREIGVYKAIGASNGDLAILFLAEAGLIGLLGGLGGLMLGGVVAWTLNAVINAYVHSQGVTATLDMFAFPIWLPTATVTFCLMMSIVGGLYPAMRAAHVDPIQAIRKE